MAAGKGISWIRGAKAWIIPLLFLLVFDGFFIGHALYTEDQRAAWDPVFLGQPFIGEHPEFREIERSHLRSDWSRLFVGNAIQVRTSWLKGFPPLWDAYSALGKPLAGNVQSEAFSPYVFLNLLAGGEFWDIKQFVVLFLAQVFCLFLARSLGLSILSSIVVAVAFSFCSYIQTWILHPHAGVAAFYPGLLWAFLKLRRQASLGALGLSAIVLALSNLAGHVETTALVGIGAAAFSFFLPAKGRGFVGGRLKFAGWVLGAVVLAALMSSVMTVPFFDYLSQSSLVASRKAHHASTTIQDWRHLLTIFDPDILGHHLTAYRGQVSFIETGFFVGSGVLLLALFGLIVGMRRHCGLVLPALLTMVFAFCCAYEGPQAQSILAKIPGVGDMPLRRFVFIASLPMALLAGQGFDILRHSHSRRGASCFGLAAGAFVAIPFIMENLGTETTLAPHLPRQNLTWFILPMVLIGAILSLALTQKRRRLLLLLLVASLGVEAQVRWRSELPTQPKVVSPPKSPVMDSLRACSETGRVLPLMWRLPPEHNAIYGVKTPRGYDGILTERFFNLLVRSGSFFGCRTVQATMGMNKGLMDMMSIRWLYSTVPIDRIVRPKTSMAFGSHKPLTLEVELEPRGKADFLVGSNSIGQPLKGISVKVVGKNGSLARSNLESEARYRESQRSFGFLYSPPEEGMKFNKIALPRCRDPHTIQFESRSPKKQKFTFTFSAESGDGLFFDYGPYPAGEIRPFEQHMGRNMIYERPSALPFVYLAPMVRRSDSVDDILNWICGDHFDPNKHTVLETAGDNRFAFDREILDAAVPVSFVRPRPEVIQAQTDLDTDQLMVVNEAFAPGWRAYVDGKEVPVFRANYLMMGVPIPKGSHDILVKYQPRYFEIAAVLSILTFVVCLVFVMKKQGNHGPTHAEI